MSVFYVKCNYQYEPFIVMIFQLIIGIAKFHYHPTISLELVGLTSVCMRHCVTSHLPLPPAERDCVTAAFSLTWALAACAKGEPALCSASIPQQSAKKSVIHC